MEEICNNLSAALCQAGLGGYKIFYEEELCDCLPDSMRNRETLEAALKNLSECGCIDVKYARGSTFCIASLKKYEAPAPEKQVAETPANLDGPKPAVKLKTYLTVSLCAFLGGAAGGAVAAVLGAVL